MGLFDAIGDAIGGVVSAVTSPISDVIGAGLSFIGGMQQNSAASANVASQQAFQQYNSNTSYQRAVADMKAAGLNPMLAYSQGGASVPSGSVAPVVNALDLGVTSARQSAALRSSVSTQASQRELVKAQVGQTLANTDTARSQADLNRANQAKAVADTALSATNAKSVALNNTLKATTLQAAINEQNAAKSWWGRNVAPYMPDLLSHTAKSAASSLLGLFK